MTYVICDKDIILTKSQKFLSESDVELLRNENEVLEYFEENQFNLKVLGLKSCENLSEQFIRIPLRQFYSDHDDETNFQVFRAKGILNWRQENKFCCTCGTLLKDHEILTARECPSCKKIIFPRISPCIIVAIRKDDKVLLARHSYRNQDIYACIAGFMESGESAEHAVEREVFEETGLKVKNITYRGSQSWPFPDQLMLGFTADYESGEIKLQPEEIADAKWFTEEECNLQNSPKPGSIAYRLIHKLY